jgi:intein-encoded DNA endonuclease-like protein
MHIATADAGVIYGEEDIVWRSNGRYRFLLKTYGIRFAKNEGEVLIRIVVSCCTNDDSGVEYALSIGICHCISFARQLAC